MEHINISHTTINGIGDAYSVKIPDNLGIEYKPYLEKRFFTTYAEASLYAAIIELMPQNTSSDDYELILKACNRVITGRNFIN